LDFSCFGESDLLVLKRYNNKNHITEENKMLLSKLFLITAVTLLSCVSTGVNAKQTKEQVKSQKENIYTYKDGTLNKQAIRLTELQSKIQQSYSTNSCQAFVKLEEETICVLVVEGTFTCTYDCYTFK
jgi:hypothetical protein